MWKTLEKRKPQQKLQIQRKDERCFESQQALGF
jgi:hypothetical protein